MRMRSLIVLAAFLLPWLCLAPAAAAAEIAAVPVEARAQAVEVLDSFLFEYQVVRLPLAAIESQVRAKGRLQVQLGESVYDLRLRLNDVRTEDYRTLVIGEDGAVEVVPRGPAATYAGEVAGEPGSTVRLTVLPDSLEGYIRRPGEWLFVEPLSRFDAGADASELVLYRNGDVRPWAVDLCGAGELQRSAELLAPEAEAVTRALTPGRLKLAIDADGEYTQHYGVSGAISRIQSIVNGMDGIYQDDFDLEIRLSFQVLWSSPGSDPYTKVDATGRLVELRNYWNSAFTWVGRDAAILLSYVDFVRPYPGDSFWIASVCRNYKPRRDYAIAQDRSSLHKVTVIATHELGHLLGGYHDDERGICPSVSCNGYGPIMCSTLQTNGADCFSFCSQEDICEHIEGCLVTGCTPSYGCSL